MCGRQWFLEKGRRERGGWPPQLAGGFQYFVLAGSVGLGIRAQECPKRARSHGREVALQPQQSIINTVDISQRDVKDEVRQALSVRTSIRLPYAPANENRHKTITYLRGGGIVTGPIKYTKTYMLQ